jgi:hypothetical protein
VAGVAVEDDSAFAPAIAAAWVWNQRAFRGHRSPAIYRQPATLSSVGTATAIIAAVEPARSRQNREWAEARVY